MTGQQIIAEIEAQPYEKFARCDNVYQIFEESARLFANETALIFLENALDFHSARRWTFTELFERVTAVANLFERLGVGPRDVVSLLLPAVPETHFALWGAEAAGIVNPINPALSVEVIAELLRAAGTKVLVAAPEHRQKADALRERVPELQHVLMTGGAFEAELARSPSTRRTRKIVPDDPAAYFHTGGTTASPKLAMQTHRNQVYIARCFENVFSRRGDVQTNGLPLFHVGGCFMSLGPWAAGAAVLMPTAEGHRNRDVVANYWKLVEHFKVTVVGAVPTTIGTLAGIPLGNADISSLECALTGGAATPIETIRRFEATAGVRLYQIYGMTESSAGGALSPRRAAPRIGAAGLRDPYAQMRIARVEPDGSPGADCKAGEQGVILLKGPFVSPGYKDARHDASAFTADGWLITGDLGYLDEDGYILLPGAAKDLIIRDVQNIDPSMLEERLVTCPGVESCAAIGQPDE